MDQNSINELKDVFQKMSSQVVELTKEMSLIKSQHEKSSNDQSLLNVQNETTNAFQRMFNQVAELTREMNRIGNQLEKISSNRGGKPLQPQAKSNSNQQAGKKTSTSGVVRQQYQVRTDGYLQRIDHYITQRKMERKHGRSLILESVLKLQSAVYTKRDQTLLDVMLKSSYVGCVDENFFLMQHELDLVMVSIRPLNNELFYQMILVDFGNFDYIQFQKALPVSELIAIYLRHNKPNIASIPEEADKIMKPILENSEMLKDYFSLKINSETGTLEALPCIVKGHMPVMNYLPDLMFQLSSNVDWTDEMTCLHDISKYLAAFYSRPPQKLTTDEEHKSWASNIERLFFPLYKTLLLPSRELATKGSFFTLTNITELYKFFERC